MLIDTHCHLNFSDYDADRDHVIKHAKKAGVIKIIVPGVDEYSSNQSLELSKKYQGLLFPTLGFHPYEAKHIYNVQTVIKKMEMHLSETIVAVGECGLDYHVYKGHNASGKKYEQIQLFEAQCLFALKHDLPLIIHCRDAWDDIYTVLDSLPTMPRGVFHCFSGGQTDIRLIQQRGMYIGIDGNVTYSRQIQSQIAFIPISMLLLETDAPYLTPDPHRGKRNQPAFLIHTSAHIAQLMQRSTEEISQSTTQNAHQLFRLN